MKDDSNTKKDEKIEEPKLEIKEQKKEQNKLREEELEKKVKQLENELKYIVADNRNQQKKLEEERKDFIRFANRELLTRLLPAFDTLLLAEKYIEDPGLKISVKKLLDVLGEVGVKRIETEGKSYDPLTMECVEVVDGEDNKIIMETRPGFTLHGKTLLPSQVKVGGKN